MSSEKDQHTAATKLRRRAEKHLQTQTTEVEISRTGDEPQRLLQELQVHQVELEMQNAELCRVRDEVEATLEKYTELYDFAPVGYVTFDRCGVICAINLAGAKLLGVERGRLTGRSFSQFVANEGRLFFSEFLEKIFTSQSKQSCELSLATAESSPLIVQIEAVAATSGEECRAAIIDISIRRKLEEKLENLLIDLDNRADELAAANVALEAFNYTVSHDLNRPLTVINGYCQILSDMCRDNLDDQCKGYIQEMYQGTLRMSRLINTLLKFSSVTRSEINRKQIDLSKIAADVARELDKSGQERQVTFKITSGIFACGDSNLLRAALDNLIGNAWKHSGHQGGVIIEFGVVVEKGKSTYFVRDNGPGFDIALANKLFIPFQRLPGTDVEGSGIGLATVDRIVKRHGGRVWVESAPGKGATFFFTLE